jgi:hypothetical protein
MDAREPIEVDISGAPPPDTWECSGCWTWLPYVSFKKDLGKEGHWETCSSCRNKKTVQRNKRKRSNSTTVKTPLITWGEKTPEEYQIDFLKRKETAINWKAGLYWF